MGEGGEQLKFTVRVLCFWLGLGLGLADIRLFCNLFVAEIIPSPPPTYVGRVLYLVSSLFFFFDIFIFSLNTV